MAVSTPSAFSAEDARTTFLAAFHRCERGDREAHAPTATTRARLDIARPEVRSFARDVPRVSRAEHLFAHFRERDPVVTSKEKRPFARSPAERGGKDTAHERTTHTTHVPPRLR